MKIFKLKSIVLDQIRIDKTIQRSAAMITTEISNLATLIQKKKAVIRVGHTEPFKGINDALFLKFGA